MNVTYNGQERLRPRWIVVWLALFGFFWAFFSWLSWIINPQSTIPSWMQGINFAFGYCFLIAWNRRHPERRPKPTSKKASPLTLLQIGAGASGTVAMVSTLTTLWLGRPGWLPTALYSLGLPVILLAFTLIIEKWGGLVESRGNDATT